jgi:glycine dehydrogenase
MNAMYAIYHGPDGLKHIANRIHNNTQLLAESLKQNGNVVSNEIFFDTIKIKPKLGVAIVRKAAEAKQINLRYYADNEHVGISLDETVTEQDVDDLLSIFQCTKSNSVQNSPLSSDNYRRDSKFLQHSVFDKYKSEALMVRYLKTLENKDYSLVHGMIPLGSCTMKLNATTELMPCSWKEFNSMHPFAPKEQAKGYMKMLSDLESDLCEITGFSKISFQPNSGAQGEYAGLRTIMQYLKANGQKHRKVCLIPYSAHGTNPATAAMTGLEIVKIDVDQDGGVNLKHIKEEINKHKNELACAMITYPSTAGVFDSRAKDLCDLLHSHGAQVYMDGANLNAQVIFIFSVLSFE